MEFDDIKKAWKNSFKKDELLDKKEIEARLEIKSKSNTALNKVKRNYRLEVYGSGALAVYVLFWLYKNITTSHKYLIIAFALIFFGALIYFAAYNYLKIKNTVISSDQLKPALKQTIADIEKYVNFSRSNFTKFILLPFSIVFGMFLGLNMAAGDQPIMETIRMLENETIFKLILLFSVACVAIVPLSLYLNKKMYKQHLDELKACLKEFEHIEDELNHNES